ncbi:MAG: PilT/PilU family type 4a pilus ATPase, partial [Planctomycetota bacterium]|nr:PilT/PilU family type 4a pilus ATPase [Planctomycetota bacterium]
PAAPTGVPAPAEAPAPSLPHAGSAPAEVQQGGRASQAKKERPKSRFQGISNDKLAQLSQTSTSPRRMVEAWLAAMCQAKASDLILRAGGRPSLRIGGKIEFLPGRVPGPGPMLEVFKAILGERRLKEWTETGSADAAIQLDGLGRFRINAYKQLGEPALVIRRIGENAPSLDDLQLPSEELKQLAMRKRGLILVTGIAGSGKSTSLAGMIQYMNENVERHIVTLEDPVELLFSEQNCVISQREIGTDTTSFADGLRHALRQSPDVILIGEVRDATTVMSALEATETGHMVMSTMHTVNAAQTMDRMLGFFPAERHSQVRQRLADNLAGVLSQRLVPARAGGLVPAYELMVSTPHIRELLEEGQTTEMAKVIEGGSEAGLISFNECLRGLVERQVVDLSDALAASDRPDELLLALRGIRGSSDRVAGPAPNGGPGHPRAPRTQRPGDNPDGLRLAGS